MVVLLFYKCTNISCSDEHLFYIALIEALELQTEHSLDPLAKSFAHRSRVGYGRSAVGRETERVWGSWMPKQSNHAAASELVLVEPC